jgi:phytoene dehydrogenase-like protein
VSALGAPRVTVWCRLSTVPAAPPAGRARAARYDAIVVGCGHNGLVASFYLARAGLSVLALERRPLVGGCCVTEEFAPGYRASTGAYVLSMLREQIWQDMRLAERGLTVSPAGPSLNLFADGERFMLSEDLAETEAEIDRYSTRDARRFRDFEQRLADMARIVIPMFNWTPPAEGQGLADLATAARLGRRALAGRRDLTDLMFLFSTSASQYLDTWFESDHLKGVLGWHAINDSVSGPSTPGTAYVLLHDHASEESGGGVRSWGFVRGGMGEVTRLMAEAAREVGAEIRTEAEVEEILTADGRVAGVRLAGGEEVTAPVVLSNADPKRTFQQLVAADAVPDSYRSAIAAYRCIGTSIKINLGVSELPRASGVDGNGEMPYHRGIMEVTSSLADMDRAQALAMQGMPAEDAHIELCIPTVHDPSLAPEGKHVVTIDINSQPYRLAGGQGSWDDIRERVADRAIAQLGDHFPNLPDSIEHRQVLSPLDLERLLGITGGHALHGDMGSDQLFALRPVPGHGDYRTPVRGLYLCGAGTHPGGGVTGANGRNCAREVMRDARRRDRVAALGRLRRRLPV